MPGHDPPPHRWRVAAVPCRPTSSASVNHGCDRTRFMAVAFVVPADCDLGDLAAGEIQRFDRCMVAVELHVARVVRRDPRPQWAVVILHDQHAAVVASPPGDAIVGPRWLGRGRGFGGRRYRRRRTRCVARSRQQPKQEDPRETGGARRRAIPSARRKGGARGNRNRRQDLRGARFGPAAVDLHSKLGSAHAE